MFITVDSICFLAKKRIDDYCVLHNLAKIDWDIKNLRTKKDKSKFILKKKDK